MQYITNKYVQVTLRNPLDFKDTISYRISVYDNDFGHRWLRALKANIEADYHLEKNYCFLGFAQSPRNGDYLCGEVNKAISQINKFNKTGYWQQHGLKSYEIDDHFDTSMIMYDPEKYPIGNLSDDKNNLGLRLIHEPMNRLHRYFEDLQGEAWSISSYYQLADYETKWAIRQLNDLCHEIESWVLSNRQFKWEPEWQRGSQITTFLNAPRLKLTKEDLELFKSNRYTRELGGVYQHWCQVGKTQYEVYRDEDGPEVIQQVCSAMNSLQYYSGEFDVEWGKTVDDSCWWHKEDIDKFKKWLEINNMSWEDPELCLGYLKLGQIDIKEIFGTENIVTIVEKLSKYLDIYKIAIHEGDEISERIFPYVWSDPNYKQMQIDFLKPGYDWSKRQYGK